jgi:hypothetical protein
VQVEKHVEKLWPGGDENPSRSILPAFHPNSRPVKFTTCLGV